MQLCLKISQLNLNLGLSIDWFCLWSLTVGHEICRSWSRKNYLDLGLETCVLDYITKFK